MNIKDNPLVRIFTSLFRIKREERALAIVLQVLRRVHTAQRPLLASVHIQVPHFGLRPHHLFGGERLDGRL